MLFEKDKNKIKLLTMSDHPMVSSGVGTQTKYILEGLLKTGRYQVVSLGGAMKHDDYRPVKVNPYDWVILPVNGYGDERIIRDLLDEEKPDAIWFMTDPRFFMWLFAMSDEIRDRSIPLNYYSVWDNYPVPKFNKTFYESCDFVGCISKLTYNIVCQLGFKERSKYIPHAVNSEIFKPLSDDEVMKKRKEWFPKLKDDAMIVFYNSRNARRKMTSDVIKCFKMFLDEAKTDNAFLFMHTDPHDHEGADLFAVCEMLNLSPDRIVFSNKRIPSDEIAMFYNVSDVTINISNAEGFGLSCLESMSCGTPVIVAKTGGLQDQAIDEDTKEQYGVVIEPATKSLTGSQQIPYIYEDKVADKDVVDALLKIFKMTKVERKTLGLRGREYTLRRFKMSDMIQNWDDAITKNVNEFKQNGFKNRIRMNRI